MTEARVPFNRPPVSARSSELLDEALAGGHLSGDGPFSETASERLAALTGSERVLLTPSCTDALEMSALLLDVSPGDEIVLPSFNFPSAANVFLLRGAQPVFVDIRPDTLNLDENLLADAMTDRTRAVVVVHYGGVACEMDLIGAIAAGAGADVVEDAAHALLGTYRGRPVGSLGRLAAASFHETKNLSCGEGGALFINDPDLVPRAEILREKGTDRSRFRRGEVDKYTWVDVGSSYLLAEPLAAMLVAQLEETEAIQERRRRAWAHYAARLAGWAAEQGIQLPAVPDHCGSAHHTFHLLMPDEAQRDALLDHLGTRGVLSVFHYLPLHLSPMGRSLGGQPGDLPVTESVSSRLARLPLFSAITDDELDRVVEAVLSFR